MLLCVWLWLWPCEEPAMEVAVLLLERPPAAFLGSRDTGGAFAMGRERPRSLPRLATPTPQVSCVLYPEHSLLTSRHCEQ